MHNLLVGNYMLQCEQCRWKEKQKSPVLCLGGESGESKQYYLQLLGIWWCGVRRAGKGWGPRSWPRCAPSVVPAATRHLVVWGEESREGLGPRSWPRCAPSGVPAATRHLVVGEESREGSGAPGSGQDVLPLTAFGLGLTIFLCTWFCPQK